MMILSAVLLVIGFIALTGMVARVNQLGTETTTESERAILSEVGPLVDAIDGGIADLRGARDVSITAKDTTVMKITVSSATPLVQQDVGRHIASATANCVPTGSTITAVLSDTTATVSGTLASSPACTATVGAVLTGRTTINSKTIQSTVGVFSIDDVGSAISGNGIPALSYVVQYNSTTAVMINQRATVTAASGVTLTMGPFALGSGTTPNLETAITTLMERLADGEARRGFFLDYSICRDVAGACVACASGQTGRVWADLWDGTVWVQVRSSVTFDCS